MSGRLAGKVALITGGGSGIGFATAQMFHEEGASVVLTGRSSAVLQAAKGLGERSIGVCGDLRIAAEVETIIQQVVTTFGGIDILCNVAGASGPIAPFLETTEDDFDEMIDINLRTVYLTMKAAIPEMLKRSGGSIVNVSSAAALIGVPSIGVYGAAKSGVVALTKAVALEYAKAGIRVNSVCPGPIDTPMLRAGSPADSNISEYSWDFIPMGRVGQPNEVASAILFLASSEAAYITGATLTVEGGQTAG